MKRTGSFFFFALCNVMLEHVFTEGKKNTLLYVLVFSCMTLRKYIDLKLDETR
jgi:hypothetical protein